MARIVALDIETAPAVAFSFTGFKANIGIDQIIEHPRIIGFSYQWEGQKRVYWADEYHDGRSTMLDVLHSVLNEADVVITYNGKNFDIPWITGELIVEGYSPVSPFQHIDLYQILKSKTRFFSRKLDYAAIRILDDRKVSHTGFKLWRDCLIGSPEEKTKAWALMKKYGLKDTALLFPLYYKIQGWITTGHPNRALLDGLTDACPRCSSEHIQKRGFKYTNASKFQQYQCQSCGAWFHDGRRVETTLAR